MFSAALEEGLERSAQVHNRFESGTAKDLSTPVRSFLGPHAAQHISVALFTRFVELIPFGQAPIIRLASSTSRLGQHDCLMLIGFQLDFMSSLNHVFYRPLVYTVNIACTSTISSVNLQPSCTRNALTAISLVSGCRARCSTCCCNGSDGQEYKEKQLNVQKFEGIKVILSDTRTTYYVQGCGLTGYTCQSYRLL